CAVRRPRRGENACDKSTMNEQAAEITFARQLVERLSSRLANEKRELVLFLIELAELDALSPDRELPLDDTNVAALLERASGLSERELRQPVMRIRLGDAAPATPPAAIVAADAVATRDEIQAITLWVGPEFREELDAVRTLLGHAVPSGKREDVLF